MHTTAQKTPFQWKVLIELLFHQLLLSSFVPLSLPGADLVRFVVRHIPTRTRAKRFAKDSTRLRRHPQPRKPTTRSRTAAAATAAAAAEAAAGPSITAPSRMEKRTARLQTRSGSSQGTMRRRTMRLGRMRQAATRSMRVRIMTALTRSAKRGAHMTQTTRKHETFFTNTRIHPSLLPLQYNIGSVSGGFFFFPLLTPR